MKLRDLLKGAGPGPVHYHLLLQVISSYKIVDKLASVRSPWMIYSVAVVATFFIVVVRNNGLLFLHVVKTTRTFCTIQAYISC